MDIEFGCGDNPKKSNYKTCDIRDIPGVDFVCNAWEIDTLVKHNSVDNVFSRHMFEHLTFIQGRKTLKSWFNILKPGGICEMILPNIDYHVNQWVNNIALDRAKSGFWGHQREGDTEVWDVHKSGYNFATLSELLIEERFISVIPVKTKGKHLHVKCQKPI